MKKRTVLQQTRIFKLTKQERPNKKTWYEIEVDYRRMNDSGLAFAFTGPTPMMETIIEFFDPSKLTKFGFNGFQVVNKWRYWKREEAEQLFTMALLKWSN